MHLAANKHFGAIRGRRDGLVRELGSCFESPLLLASSHLARQRSDNGDPTVASTRGPNLCGTFEEAGGIGGLLSRSEWDSVRSTWSHAFCCSDGVSNLTALAVSRGGVIVFGGSYRCDPFGRLISAPNGLTTRHSQRFSSN